MSSTVLQFLLLKISHLEITFCFPALVFFCNILSLIKQFFTFCQTDFYLYQAVAEVNLQRYQSIALLCNLPFQFADFIFVKQQLLYSQRVFIENISFLIWADVHSIDKHFFMFNPDK